MRGWGRQDLPSIAIIIPLSAPSPSIHHSGPSLLLGVLPSSWGISAKGWDSAFMELFLLTKDVLSPNTNCLFRDDLPHGRF